MLKSSYWSAASQPITRRCGVGCSDMAPNWNCGYDGISRPPTSRGVLTRLTLKVKGRWCYLYRAIDSSGATIDFLLSTFRDADAAKRLFRKALSDRSHPQPRVINTDLAPIYTSAIPAIKKEGTLRRRCRHRPVQYLNNIIEQDHRAIKRRVNAKQGFREFQAARRTIQGYEVIHMMRKGQVRWVSGTDIRRQNQFINNVFELAA
jgi:IS6 family transposase